MKRAMRLKQVVAGLYCSGLVAMAGQAHAMGLLDAYNDALRNDPVFRSAVSDNQLGQEYKILGRSNLLPSLSIQYSGSKNYAETSQSGYGTTYPRYISSTGGLQFRQPLYNPDGVARYHEGNSQAEQSDVVFSGRQQELLTRVVAAYLDALGAEDSLRLAIAQRDALAEQRQANDRMFTAGEGTKTDMLETQARLDLAEEQVIEAKDANASSLHALAAIVGHDVTQVDGLSAGFHVQPIVPRKFEDWKDLALQHNPEIQAQRINVDIAEQEVKRNRAGHLPRLDLVASATKDKADTIDTYTTDSFVKSVGVQLTVPLYAGGSVSALTRQAFASYEKSKTDLEDKINQVTIDMHKQHYSVLSSTLKIEALEKSVVSAKLLVDATKQSIKGGVRVNLDLLNAEQQLYSAERDLAQAKYAYLMADLKLRADAGTLTLENLQNIAGYFASAH